MIPLEVQARLRYLRTAPRKLRKVADLIRGQDCALALSVLQATPQRGARPIEKLVRSALANAESRNDSQNAGIDLDGLYVKRILVDGGPNNWRTRPRAMGRASWINKATSHVTVVLDER